MKSPLNALTTTPRTMNRAPVPYTANAVPGLVGSNLNRERNLRATEASGTLYSVVNRLSVSLAAVPWGLYRNATAARVRRPVTEHLAWRVLSKPNPYMTTQQLFEVSNQHMELTGEAWWVTASDPSMPRVPLELWPVRPDRMLVVPDPVNFIAGYVYISPNGQRVPLETWQVIPTMVPDPNDPYRGLGPVQPILIDVESQHLASQYNRNFFKNGAGPGGIIKFDHRLDRGEFDELRMRWQEQHQGVHNAHRIAILEDGEWIDRNYTMKDMQFTELRAVSRDTIREAFGIPKFALGDVDDVNRASAEASKALFSSELIVPRLERFKQTLNTRFLPLFGPPTGVEFDYDSPVPEDEESENTSRESKVRAYTQLLAAGVDPMDAAEFCDMPYLNVAAKQPEMQPQEAV